MFPTGSVQGEFRKHGSIRTCSLATTRNVTEKAREHRELAHSTSLTRLHEESAMTLHSVQIKEQEEKRESQIILMLHESL